jgi:adhesin/invasin
LTLCVCSCGGGGSAADPMGTGTVTLTADATEVQAGGSCTLTATVTNQTGEKTTVPVIGERVSFSLLTRNGGTLAAASDRTGSGGVATAIYTAGNNLSQDVIRVTTDVGATASITITKTGGIAGARISSLVALPTTVAADQTSVITATVTDGNSNPMQGETVTFTLPVNESSAGFVNAAGVYVSSVSVNTDASGNAVAMYQAGSASSGTAVQDTVQAVLANGSSNAVVITRSAGTDLSVSVAASPTSVSAGQTSIITATVIGDNKAGAAVAFTLPVNESGACFINASNACVVSVLVNTDASGNAVAIYHAGSNSPNVDVYDTVRATLANGSSNAVVIARSAGTDLSVSVAASPTSVSAGQTSIITATVTGDEKSGAAVTFSLPVKSNSSGASFINGGSSVSSITLMAGGSGIATAIYRAGFESTGTAVQDTVQAVLTNGAVSAVTITRSAGVTGYIVTVTPTPDTLTTRTGVSLITANVKDNLGAAYVGAIVTFTVTTSEGVGITMLPATTDGNGNAVSNYSSNHGKATSDIVTASTTIGGVTYTGAATITVP